ncbi:MAG: YbaN family protein [Actinomycetota bacterium]
MRLIYLMAGLLSVAIGGIGIFVPGLPTTVFFIIAAWCFSKSNERLERWVLELPGIGPMVSDYRDGLGMPRRAKVFAIGSIVLAVGLSAGLLIDNLTVRLIVVAAGLVGVWYVGIRVPTRETVLAQRAGVGDDTTGSAWGSDPAAS